MRYTYLRVFKQFFHDHLKETKETQHLTQIRLANLLVMDPRSLRDIECGTDTCSALTLVFYFLFCCEDPLEFLTSFYDQIREDLPVDFRQVLQYSSHTDPSFRIARIVCIQRLSGDTELSPICPRCATVELKENMLFCPNCGQKLKWNDLPKAN